MAKFDNEQLAQLRIIFEGERFHTENMIDRKLTEALQPLKNDLTDIKATVQRLDEKEQEDTDALVSTVVSHDTQLKEIRHHLKLAPVGR